jgi:hypothetical protein
MGQQRLLTSGKMLRKGKAIFGRRQCASCGGKKNTSLVEIVGAKTTGFVNEKSPEKQGRQLRGSHNYTHVLFFPFIIVRPFPESVLLTFSRAAFVA